ncbi:hypothetical protein [Micromonospora sp. WMMD710]|uniref:hypothetical protein n=1 Tax=Micromonospora sp. WMMD710 TaxID=3016085 RepID=UPI0024171476|nr:hypothetical protein [Micromonospora sp. WMMD710]MDG4758988.1 hypothetical protein [Micromonospora sp. WMMD710]
MIRADKPGLSRARPGFSLLVAWYARHRPGRAWDSGAGGSGLDGAAVPGVGRLSVTGGFAADASVDAGAVGAGRCGGRGAVPVAAANATPPTAVSARAATVVRPPNRASVWDRRTARRGAAGVTWARRKPCTARPSPANSSGRGAARTALSSSTTGRGPVDGSTMPPPSSRSAVS